MKTKSKIVMILAALAFSGCDNGGGGGDGGTPVSVPGVTVGTFSAVGSTGESCTIAAATYTCTDNINGQVRITPVQGFTTQQELCAKIIDNNINQNIAYASRNYYYQNYCVNVGGINNGLPVTPGLGVTKKFVCELYVKKGDVEGNTGPMEIPASSNVPVNLYAFLNRNKTFLKVFNYNSVSTSNRLANTTMTYIPANGRDGDLVKLTVKSGSGSSREETSITGFAGTQTRLEVASDDYSDMQVSISCSSVEATNAGVVATAATYSCSGTEKETSDPIRKIRTRNHMSDLVDSGLELTKKINLTAEGTAVTGQGTVSFSTSGRRGGQVNTISNLTTASNLVIKRDRYSLDVKCRPGF